jgi:predicted nucleic acid-binding protein
MQSAIISDTSCLILLDKIGELEILKKLFGEVIITSVISEEFGASLPEWIKIKNALNEKYEASLQTSVDKGEASAIALAVEEKDCLLILDDQKARKLASELGLDYTGTLGVLIEAKLSGHIISIKPILDKIQRTNFRITPELLDRILKSTGE